MGCPFSFVLYNSYHNNRGIIMSMSVHISATREIFYVNPKNKNELIPDVQTITFTTQHTTTTETYEIVRAKNEIKAYCRVMQRKCVSQIVDVYAADDIFGETPIGQKEYRWADCHCKDLNDWIRAVKTKGYTLTVSMI